MPRRGRTITTPSAREVRRKIDLNIARQARESEGLPPDSHSIIEQVLSCSSPSQTMVKTRSGNTEKEGTSAAAGSSKQTPAEGRSFIENALADVRRTQAQRPAPAVEDPPHLPQLTPENDRVDIDLDGIDDYDPEGSFASIDATLDEITGVHKARSDPLQAAPVTTNVTNPVPVSAAAPSTILEEARSRPPPVELSAQETTRRARELLNQLVEGNTRIQRDLLTMPPHPLSAAHTEKFKKLMSEQRALEDRIRAVSATLRTGEIALRAARSYDQAAKSSGRGREKKRRKSGASSNFQKMEVHHPTYKLGLPTDAPLEVYINSFDQLVASGVLGEDGLHTVLTNSINSLDVHALNIEVQDVRAKENIPEDVDLSWEVLRECLLRAVRGEKFREDLQKELLNFCRQDNESLRAMNGRYIQLLNIAGLTNSRADDAWVAYSRHLGPSIFQRVSKDRDKRLLANAEAPVLSYLMGRATYYERLAGKLDMPTYGMQTGYTWTPAGTGTPLQEDKPKGATGSKSDSKPRAGKDAGSNSSTTAASSGQASSSNKSKKMYCFRCRSTDHYTRDCPTKKKNAPEGATAPASAKRKQGNQQGGASSTSNVGAYMSTVANTNVPGYPGMFIQGGQGIPYVPPGYVLTPQQSVLTQPQAVVGAVQSTPPATGKYTFDKYCSICQRVNHNTEQCNRRTGKKGGGQSSASVNAVVARPAEPQAYQSPPSNIIGSFFNHPSLGRPDNSGPQAQ